MTSGPIAQVVVLGDVGHSPRMQYHALCLCEKKFKVQMIGYAGSPVIEKLSGHPQFLGVVGLQKFPVISFIPRTVNVVFKVLFEVMQLLWILLSSPRARLFICQTPPAIPTLAVVGLAAKTRGVPVIFDFHNLAYTLMGKFEARDAATPFIRAAYFIEKFSARLFCRAGLVVSQHMRRFLETEWGLNGLHVLYDRPGPQFNGRAKNRVSALASLDGEKFDDFVSVSESKPTLATYDFILVSGTSWTPDEDFGLLLRSCAILDQEIKRYHLEMVQSGLSGAIPRSHCGEPTKIPKLLLFITGKGPGKADFVSAFRRLSLRYIDLCTSWLPAEQYPVLLSVADLGLSLHASSSGLDLPMKVVDMIGAELPVLSKRFEAIGELVTSDVGRLFDTEDELAEHIFELTYGGMVEARVEMQEGASKKRKITFEKGWQQVMKEPGLAELVVVSS